MSHSAITLQNVPRSSHDLSHSKKFTAYLGELMPVGVWETVPGDKFQISYEFFARALALATPMMHRIDVRFWAFYIPYRILMSDPRDWISFITGGEDGDDTTTLPTWNPSAAAKRNAGTLWDFLHDFSGVTPDSGSLPLDFGRRAYMAIFNRWFRDVAVEPEIDWSQPVGTNQDMDGNALPTGYNDDEDLQYVSWTKDRFTAARPDQQLGDPVSLAIGSATWDASSIVDGVSSGNTVTFNISASDDLMRLTSTSSTGRANALGFMNDNTIASVDVSEMRLAFQVQKWQELNMRAGVRYPEWTKAHFGVNLNDATIQEPIFIGSASQPVVISDVEQTAEGTGTTVGELAGKGTTSNNKFLGNVFCPEFGLVMVLGAFRPKASYHQGIGRMWTRRDRYDFYSPEFANLSEEPILRRELYVNAVQADNETVFGYAPIWDELRVKEDSVHGLLQPGETYDDWHAGRTFASAPTLSASFIRMHDPNEDPWAVAGQPHFVCNYMNIVKAVRPIPFISTPGNVDR